MSAIAPDPADLQLVTAVLAGGRRELARLITLLESALPAHRQRADAVLQCLLPHTGRALRVGISGVPGAGKSTFIEALGMQLIAAGQRVAVLSVDPSSAVSGGSILADKTRMTRLAASEQAFIRPSPSAGTLGGVAAATREAMLACEAAGYGVVLVETVGVGQSESAVSSLTDVLLVLQVPHTGDDLQAIKRGLLEMADIIAVNKCDVDAAAAQRAAAQLHAARGQQVRCVSALKQSGLEELWADVNALYQRRLDSGEIAKRRQQQNVRWMWDLLVAGLEDRLRNHKEAQALLAEAEEAVRTARLEPRVAAMALLNRFTRME